ncbi:MAG: cell division protein FtsL [Treponema sp.]|nr:cell division protein FtsL [Treponema sp.]
MKKDSRQLLKTVVATIAALCVPALLVVNGIQARKYTELRNEVLALEKKQEDLVEQNKKLITDISLLSSSDRIQRIAEDELGMRRAETEEIVRVEMKDAKK